LSDPKRCSAELKKRQRDGRAWRKAEFVVKEVFKDGIEGLWLGLTLNDESYKISIFSVVSSTYDTKVSPPKKLVDHER